MRTVFAPAARTKAMNTTDSAPTPIRTAFHGHAPEVTILAPMNVSSPTDGGDATATRNGIQPTVTIQPSAPGSHSSGRAETIR